MNVCTSYYMYDIFLDESFRTSSIPPPFPNLMLSVHMPRSESFNLGTIVNHVCNLLWPSPPVVETLGWTHNRRIFPFPSWTPLNGRVCCFSRPWCFPFFPPCPRVAKPARSTLPITQGRIASSTSSCRRCSTPSSLSPWAWPWRYCGTRTSLASTASTGSREDSR